MTVRVQRSTTWPTLLLAAGAWVLLDLIRAWSPTLITIFGQAASTPPENIGAFALGCSLVPVVLVLAVRRRRRAGGRLAWVALAVAVLARVVLQVSDGGYPHLVVATAGVVAAMTWLALALTRHAHVAVTGLVTGLALSVLTHAALGTWGAVWRTDAWAWLLLAVQVGLVVLAAARARGGAVDGSAGSGAPAGLPRRLAWTIWPGLFLAGVVVANAGRASAVADWLGLALIAAGSTAAIIAARAHVSRWSVALAGLVLVAVVACALVVVTDGLTPAWVTLGYLVGMPALAHLWAAADGGRAGSPVTVAIGGVVWVVLLFAYYAGYDLGYRADVAVIAVAVLIAVLALLGGAQRTARAPLGRSAVGVIGGLAVLAGVVAAVGPSVTIRPVAAGTPVPGTTTVAAYNLRMGYGIDGRFSTREVADVLARSQVALISEVDRGWYLNGGQDQLAVLERLLGRTACFGAAADPVWGDAVLIDADRVRIQRHPLPSHGAVTGAGAVVVQGEGSTITFVSTHLQPTSGDGVTAQAADLAAILEPVIGGGGPVVLGGDFNMVEGSEAYDRVVATGLVDVDPGGAFTSPADEPSQRIDYVFVTPDLRVIEVEVGQTLASDHLPVLVTLETGATD